MMSYYSRKKTIPCPMSRFSNGRWNFQPIFRSSPRGIATSLLYRRRIEDLSEPVFVEFSQLVGGDWNHGMDYDG